MNKTPLSAAALTAAALTLTACNPASDGPETSPEPVSTTPTLAVAAAFYPLAFVAERVGGERVDVELLTQPGVEAHDLELSPVSVRAIGEADVVLYLEDFQHAVEDAIAATSATAWGVEQLVDIHGDAEHDDHEHEHEDHDEHEHEDHGDHGDHDDHDHEDHDDHDHGTGGDPHFWLDPALLADYGNQLAAELARIDPDGAATYTANAAALARELDELDHAFEEGLAQCERDTVLVSHEAFGYLADRYGFEQLGASGLNPDAEPSPARIRELRETAAATGATTVFVETLVDSSALSALAADAGLEVEVLDPVEGLVDPDDDYLAVMYRNLDALEAGLGCS